MLILARKVNERIMIGHEIEVSVVEIRGDQVKIGIVAPPAVKVHRREVFDAIQAENREAASSAGVDLPSLSGLLGPSGPGESNRGTPRTPGEESGERPPNDPHRRS